MAKYYRQCPHCGGRTTETSCEICGRKTFSTSDEVMMDIPTSNQQVSKPMQNQDTKMPKEGHLQKMLNEGRNYQKQPKENKGSKKNVFAIAFSVLLVIAPILFSFWDEKQAEDDYDYYYDRIDEQYMYFIDYLVTVQDDTPITCEIDDTDKEWFYLVNTTPYMFDADVELETKDGKETSSIYGGSPYDYESDIAYSNVESCKVTFVQYQNLNIYNTNIAYGVTYDDEYHKEILLDEEVSEKELEILLKRIYALHILSYDTYDESMHIMVNGDYKYEVEIDYENANMFVTNMDNQQKTVISLDII